PLGELSAPLPRIARAWGVRDHQALPERLGSIRAGVHTTFAPSNGVLSHAVSDAAVAEEAPRGPSTAVEPEPPAHAAGVWGVRCWISAALFLLVVLCFALPFASTSCSVPGGFGRGAAGSSTVYRGLDIALDAVPAVNPPDKPTRPEALPNDGQLGFQPLALLALLVAIAGVPLSLLTGRRGARTVAAWAAVTAALLIFA